MTSALDQDWASADASREPRIIVLVVYFGRWPEYLPLFLDGCARNASIDFLFISDCGETDRIDATPNCRSVRMQLGEVEALARRRCETPLRLPTPYKLCDLKPAYGDIFAEHLAGYEYWAWTDIDVVYGDLRSHLAKLRNYDGFFVNAPWVSGVLGLLRNTRTLRRLYREARGWEESFAADEYVGFDECGRRWAEVEAAGGIENLAFTRDTFTHTVRAQERNGAARFHFGDLVHEGYPRNLLVDGDIRAPNGRSYLLFHFVSAKSGWAFVYPPWSRIPPLYWITRHGFFEREPTRTGTVRMLLTPRALRQIGVTLFRRLRTACVRLIRGDARFVREDLVRRLRAALRKERDRS